MPVRSSSPHPAARGVETDLGRTRRARRINRALAAEYPDAHCELDFTSPFELTVATVLSAQTTDVRVNQVTPELFRRFPTPAALAAAGPGELEEILRPLGFFRAKARSLIGLGEALLAHFDGEIPRDLEDLVTLPGVGRKTALVVRGNAFGLPGLAVDTHVSRLAQRLMLTEETDVLRIEQDLCGRIEKKEWTMFSHRMIFHGRRVCHARRPQCGECVIARDCPSREVAA
ncbi:endonuclease III [Corynebacterium humireducens NBRC 106098 = DSM 45392]|uniref:Endonuclease III n=1 Tax=Corynebacterium humireducens NBRC 106098 = DSM 45392 TaxID=1223515 RepID=A0A0B5D8E2_9CORY|nr:endonuclease III [Corynebacterium humireducens]AJE32064.1 endonuclease III [Corynebacterium humireducens NBRC 106098 = DSM 45392]